MSGEPHPTRPVALLLEYEGTQYHGVQAQPHTEATIQHQLEAAARKLGSSDPDFAAAGRTDAGVHATGQVVRVRLPLRLPDYRLARALNAVLPRDIRVRRAVRCGDEFHPRFDAIGRQYVYRLCARSEPPALERHFVAHDASKLDSALTIAAAASFMGKWEMKEWRSRECQAVRTALTIDSVYSVPPEDCGHPPRPYWEFHITARSFLHHQVRFMVGAIVAVGSGRLKLGALRQALREGRRPREASVMPACGLCLVAARYPLEKDPFAATGDAEEPVT